MGLLDKIQKAKTSKKVEELLGEGKGYESASPKTIRKWDRAAQSRLNELGVSKTDKKSKKSRKKDK
tara:strand:- start:180 stop:377 length:198 start_codon:yes stop_codon:yes gene_type:complete